MEMSPMQSQATWAQTDRAGAVSWGLGSGELGEWTAGLRKF